MNSFDFNSIGPISSQTMTSELINAFFNPSAANLHPLRLTKYFPTLGPFSVPEANTTTLVMVDGKWHARLNHYDYEGPRHLLKKGTEFKAVSGLYRDGKTFCVRIKQIV